MRLLKVILSQLSNRGSGRSKCPWRLVNWVEEVLCITETLKSTFKHILSKANEVADSLAREGASTR